MRTRLGLSRTSTSLGWVLVDGWDADGEAIDYDEFDVPTGAGATAAPTAELASAARRAHAIATAGGHHVHSVGLTWSDDVDTDAKALVESLADLECDTVVAVESSRAARALARGIGRGIGYQKTAVCVMDPGDVTVVIADRDDGTARTRVGPRDSSPEGLSHWLTGLLERNRWRPNGLVLVGPHTDVDTVKSHLDDALPIEVFVLGEAQLPLALGAALASTGKADSGWLGEHDAGGQSWVASHARAVTMVVTCVIALLGAVLLIPVRDSRPAQAPAAPPHSSPLPVLHVPPPAESSPTLAPPAAPPLDEPEEEPTLSLAAEPVEAPQVVTPPPLAPAPAPQEPITPPQVAPAPPAAPPAPPGPIDVILHPIFSGLP